MLDKALAGSTLYKAWMLALLALMGLGGYAYLRQFDVGLGLTGMSRDVSWGLYISQFTFLVGVAASAVMLVIPYYLHDYKTFGKLVIFGEFLAVASVIMCLAFVIVDLGQPMRLLNILIYPTPNSILFWDMIVLNVYLMINLLCGWTALESERKGAPPPKWVKPLIYLSIPWAISIHTVTAFLYAGLPGRHFWLTAILAPRFLASAFSSGPALLIMAVLIVKRYSGYDVGGKALRKLAVIITYAAIINVFFVMLEVFTAFYGNIPSHKHALTYLYVGLNGANNLVPFMWVSAVFAVAAIAMFLTKARRSDGALFVACALLFTSFWIDKGIGLVLGGFVPSPLEHITEYYPTLNEIAITVGIWAMGFFILSALYKTTISVRAEQAQEEAAPDA